MACTVGAVVALGTRVGRVVDDGGNGGVAIETGGASQAHVLTRVTLFMECRVGAVGWGWWGEGCGVGFTIE